MELHRSDEQLAQALESAGGNIWEIIDPIYAATPMKNRKFLSLLFLASFYAGLAYATSNSGANWF